MNVKKKKKTRAEKPPGSQAFSPSGTREEKIAKRFIVKAITFNDCYPPSPLGTRGMARFLVFDSTAVANFFRKIFFKKNFKIPDSMFIRSFIIIFFFPSSSSAIRTRDHSGRKKKGKRKKKTKKEKRLKINNNKNNVRKNPRVLGRRASGSIIDRSYYNNFCVTGRFFLGLSSM